jgi:hypothetical protein
MKLKMDFDFDALYPGADPPRKERAGEAGGVARAGTAPG